MKTTIRAGLAALMLAVAAPVAAPAFAQEAGITVRAVRIMGANAEALAKFYSQALGMSEVRRPVESAAFTEIVINTGSTPELAKKATTTPIVIATRRANEPKAGGMAALILEVENIDAAIKRAEAAGAKLMRPAAKTASGQTYAFLTDPEGNQFELLTK